MSIINKLVMFPRVLVLALLLSSVALFHPILAEADHVKFTSLQLICYHFNPDHPYLDYKFYPEYAWGAADDLTNVQVQGTISSQIFKAASLSLSNALEICERSIPKEHRLLEIKVGYDELSFGEYPIQFADQQGLPLPGSDDSIERVVIFGDSLSDTGGLKRTFPLYFNEPYWMARSSDGRMWPEILESFGDVAVLNLSISGQTSRLPKIDADYGAEGSSITEFIWLTLSSLITKTGEQMVDLYFDKQPSPSELNKTLFVLWLGGNDPYDPCEGDFEQKLLAEREAVRAHKKKPELVDTSKLDSLIDKVYKEGARHLLVIGIPGLEYHCRNLEQEISVLNFSNEHSDFDIKYVDMLGFIQKSTADFKLNTDGGCYKGRYFTHLILEDEHPGLCENPNDYLMWDQYHPTSRTHCLMASEFKRIITGSDVLDPKLVKYCSDPGERLDTYGLRLKLKHS